MSPAYVVDANVAVKWVVEEAGSSQARVLFRSRLEAPDFLLIECSNVLWKKATIGELSSDQALTRLAALADSPIRFSPSAGLLGDALRLAIDLRQPVYDCIYLALAMRRELVLVSDDRAFVLASARGGLDRYVQALKDIEA